VAKLFLPKPLKEVLIRKIAKKLKKCKKKIGNEDKVTTKKSQAKLCFL